jgi:hypothetical protein
MYLRTTSQTRKDGTVVRYLQLAHNVWNAEKGRAEATVLYNFGREDPQSRDTLERLVRSIGRYLHPGESEMGEPALPDFTFTESRPLGGAYVLDALWQALGIGETVTRFWPSATGTAGRTLTLGPRGQPGSLPVFQAGRVRVGGERRGDPGLPEISDDALYRSMDFLLDIAPALEEAVFHQVANLLNLEVDLLFFDTTSTYFCIDGPTKRSRETDGGGRSPATVTTRRPPPPPGSVPTARARTTETTCRRSWWDSRSRERASGARVVWPGNTSDSALIRQVKADLREWTLSGSSGWPTGVHLPGEPPLPTARGRPLHHGGEAAVGFQVSTAL